MLSKPGFTHGDLLGSRLSICRKISKSEWCVYQGYLQLSREKLYLSAPVEIDVHAFHDALGLMYPVNWRSSENGECETFMLAEMVCGNVTEIYARIGIRYYRMRDYSNLGHAEILAALRGKCSARNEKSRLSPALTRRIYSLRNDGSGLN